MLSLELLLSSDTRLRIGLVSLAIEDIDAWLVAMHDRSS